MRGVSERMITSIGVVGAGTMGAGIAQVAILTGFQVRLYDPIEGALPGGRSRIAQSVTRAVQRGHVQAEAAEQALGRLTAVTRLTEMREAQLILEAAPEELSLKQRVFAELDGVADPGAILASNTSSLSITAIAGATKHPGRVVGMHFFNPVPVMTLVEVVAGQRTEPAVVE